MLVIPLWILVFIVIVCGGNETKVLLAINKDTINLFVAVVSIIMGFLINFLVLAKTGTNTLFHKYDNEYDACVKKANDDTDKLDECELRYKENKAEIFYKLNFNIFKSKNHDTLKLQEDIELYVYNKIFFIIFLSVIFPILYFIGINFVSILFEFNTCVLDLMRVIALYFILFYLFNVFNLLSYLYVLFFSDTE